MLAALRHRKISSRLEGVEDLLTSVVFGVLRHIPVSSGLVPFLGLARDLAGSPFPDWIHDTREADVYFWPWWDEHEEAAGAEPDVVLVLTNRDGSRRLVVVEAKWRSGKSGEGTRDQLARQAMNAELIAHANDAEFAGVIYLTAHLSAPAPDIKRSASVLKTVFNKQVPLLWSSWRDIPPLLEEFSTADEGALSAQAAEAAALLRQWGLERFTGVSPVTPLPCWRFGGASFAFEALSVPTWSFGAMK